MNKLLVLIFLCSATYSFAQHFEGIPSGTERIASSNHQFEKKVLALVNKIRKKRHKKPLKWNESLAHAARYHAMDMAQDKYFEHDTQDLQKNGSHKKVCDSFVRMDKFVDDNVFASAENIQAGADTPEEVVMAWMKSRGHRRNILAKGARYLGVGYIYLEESPYQIYWVQNFGNAKN